MPKWGPKKVGTERFVRELIDEIDHKQKIINRHLGIEHESIEQTVPRFRTAVDVFPETVLEVEVEKTILRGRTLLRGVAPRRKKR